MAPGDARLEGCLRNSYLRNSCLRLPAWFVLSLFCLNLFNVGCSRGHYRLRADADAYGRIVEKNLGRPWQVPGGFSVYPAPNSRLYDETCVNDPCLPSPAPQLYAYDLPEIPERDNGRFRPRDSAGEELAELEVLAASDSHAPPEVELEGKNGESNLGVTSGEEAEQVFKSVSYSAGQPLRIAQELPPPDPVPDGIILEDEADRPVVNLVLPPIEMPSNGVDAQLPSPADVAAAADEDSVAAEQEEVQAKQVPLPETYWESFPPECLARMFAFESVRSEYARSYGYAPRESQRDGSPKLALEDIVSLTLLNSRELQTQKENLFRVALVLTLERFDYQLRPSVGNNGSAANYTHSRVGGTTVDTLRIPTAFQLEKMMYSGADFIGRFANDVLLTFNGPQGFAVDVGSELFFNFSQSLLQRDVRLEDLTQAERNVVYAARDFTRFRRELFVQQATDYYSLIRQFRQIEIQCQNYFTLAREFNQRSVEIKFGMAARTQLDQVEQQVINGRQSILSSCTNLENALDSLKIRMGIPTEQPLNIDLTELNLITLSDELAVNAELINRTLVRIRREVDSEERSPFVLVGNVSQLVEQMRNSLRLRKALGESAVDTGPLENRLLELRLEAADIDVAEDRQELDKELAEASPDSTKVVQRRRDVSAEIGGKILWQLRMIETLDFPEGEVSEWERQYENLNSRLTELEKSFLNLIFREQSATDADSLEELEAAEKALLVQADSLQKDMESLANLLDRRLGRSAASAPQDFEARAIEFANELTSQSETFLQNTRGGLLPIQIDMDDAMMTALVQRFDLMNQRGFLADDWRQIKYDADDLRSILNLNASQTIRTRSGENRPFDFTFDDSTTSANVSLDLPFNRRAQRNRFRTSLFDYQQTLRNVMQLEDNIKLAVRRDLRTLKLDRQQYINDVAGAALASERVTGTELEVRGGFATSRDFLESQQAYVQAISGVASDHINYIVGRLELFLDLESLSVGEDGFWDKLYDEEHQPEPAYQLPGYARPGYGELHPRLKYSKMIQRMRCVPDGVSMVHERQTKSEQEPSGSSVE